MEFLFVFLLQAAAGDPAPAPAAAEPAQQTEQVDTAGTTAEAQTAEAQQRVRCTRRAPTNSRLRVRICDTEENIQNRQREAEDATREIQRVRMGTPAGN